MVKIETNASRQGPKIFQINFFKPWGAVSVSSEAEVKTDAASLLNLNLLGICAVACHSKPQVQELIL